MPSRPVARNDGDAPRCAHCGLFSFDATDGVCGRCASGRTPMSPEAIAALRPILAKREASRRRAAKQRRKRSLRNR